MKTKKHFNKAELITSIIGLIIFLFVFIYMLKEALLSNNTSPDIVIEKGMITEHSSSYVVEITVFNNGNSTAEGLEIEGSLYSNNVLIESSKTTFDYVPKQSQRKGGLIFTNNPEENKIVFRASGFEEP